MLLRKPVIEYYVRAALRAFKWFLLILTGVFALTIAGMGAINIGVVQADGTSYFGVEVAFFIFFTIACMSDFTAEFHFMFQHGVSRRSAFAGFSAHMLIMSAIQAVVLMLASALFYAVGTWLGAGINHLFPSIYGAHLEALGTIPGGLLTFLFLCSMLLLGGTLGYFISVLLYRLNKLGKSLLGGGLVALAMTLPFLNILSGGRVVQFFLWLRQVFVGRGDTPNLLNGVGVFAVLTVIGLFGTWLLIRRVKLKK